MCNAKQSPAKRTDGYGLKCLKQIVRKSLSGFLVLDQHIVFAYKHTQF